MKLFILLMGLLLSSVASSCPISYRFASNDQHIQGLASYSDTIVWVELLDKQVIYPLSEELEVNSSNAATLLDELLALVKRDKINQSKNLPNINVVLNSLQLIKGNSLALELNCQSCRGAANAYYNKMSVGKQYLMYYRESQLLGVTEINDADDYQRIMNVIEQPELDL